MLIIIIFTLPWNVISVMCYKYPFLVVYFEFNKFIKILAYHKCLANFKPITELSLSLQRHCVQPTREKEAKTKSAG